MESAEGGSALLTMMLLQMPVAPVVVMLYAALVSLVCSYDKQKVSTPALALAAADGAPRVWRLPKKVASWKALHNRVRRMDDLTRNRQWRRRYRMSFPAFTALVEQLRPYLVQETEGAVEVERALAMVLHRLADGSSAATIAYLYGVPARTVSRYTRLVTEALACRRKLYSKYVVMPAGRRLHRITQGFQAATGLPNMCGAIDGTHIKLCQKPGKLRQLQLTPVQHYWSEHGFYSILLQGVCDADCVFWNVCCNGPGALHDAAHFRSSRLWTELMEGGEVVEPLVKVEGKEIRPYLVGDSAYPLLPFLITPFTGNGNCGEEQSVADQNAFDAQLKKGREKIEAAFGMLKSRWKIMRNMNVGLQYAAQTAVACCVLHNFCQLHGEPVPCQYPVDPHLNHSSYRVPVLETEKYLASYGQETRMALFSYWLERRGEDDEDEDDEEGEEMEDDYTQPEHDGNIFTLMGGFCASSEQQQP